MSFTETEAIEAIRQHPHLAAAMAPTKTELEIINNYESVTSSELESKHSSRSNASRFMRGLISKGYFKRVKSGLFVKL